jgi:hypothetical protein
MQTRAHFSAGAHSCKNVNLERSGRRKHWIAKKFSSAAARVGARSGWVPALQQENGGCKGIGVQALQQEGVQGDRGSSAAARGGRPRSSKSTGSRVVQGDSQPPPSWHRPRNPPSARKTRRLLACDGWPGTIHVRSPHSPPNKNHALESSAGADCTGQGREPFGRRAEGQVLRHPSPVDRLAPLMERTRLLLRRGPSCR